MCIWKWRGIQERQTKQRERRNYGKIEKYKREERMNRRKAERSGYIETINQIKTKETAKDRIEAEKSEYK
jgi:hypothetical protein